MEESPLSPNKSESTKSDEEKQEEAQEAIATFMNGWDEAIAEAESYEQRLSGMESGSEEYKSAAQGREFALRRAKEALVNARDLMTNSGAHLESVPPEKLDEFLATTEGYLEEARKAL